MKLTITNFLGKIITLDVEPNTSIVDLMVMVYKSSNRIDELVMYNNDTDRDGIKLDVGKNIENYALNETTILKLYPTEQLEIPDELCCPLSMQIFLDPVVMPCGTTVERQFIEKWISEKGKSPFNRTPLTEKDLKIDEMMQKKVNAFFEKHQDNPFINAIKEIKQYQFQEYSSQLPVVPLVREASEPDTDDLLAMNSIGANNYGFFQGNDTNSANTLQLSVNRAVRNYYQNHTPHDLYQMILTEIETDLGYSDILNVDFNF